MTVDSSVAPAEQAAMVRRETVANTLATIVIAAVLTWLIFRGQASIEPLAAAPDGIFGILPGTFNFTLLVTIVLSLVIRARVRRGAVGRLAPGEGSRVGAALPGNVLLRGIVLALIVTLLFVPLTYGLCYALSAAGVLPDRWTFAGMLAFFVAYFTLLAWLVTPVIVWRALRD
ncbi:MAG TPA: hypothetical protein P5528_09880 [Steroidobacteraceae bacterium]|nr:hypothetical protein [Steroidobacteraceae bacterium]